MKWWWSTRYDSARMKEQAERQAKTTSKLTPLIERFAEHLADLPDDEFAARVRAAFRRPA